MAYETVRVEALTPVLGAEVSDIDLGRPLSNREVSELHEALVTYHVLFFRDQKLDYDSAKALGGRFGELHDHPNTPGPAGHPEVLPIDADAKSNRVAGEVWHSDVSCDEEPPLGSILYLHTVPATGGDTLFASQYAAYDPLSPRLKDYLAGLTALHDGGPYYRSANAKAGIAETGRLYPSATHPVVRTHPVTRRKGLYVNRGFATPHQRAARGGRARDTGVPYRPFDPARVSGPLLLAAPFGRVLGQPRGAASRDLGLFPGGAIGLPRDDQRRPAGVTGAVRNLARRVPCGKL